MRKAVWAILCLILITGTVTAVLLASKTTPLGFKVIAANLEVNVTELQFGIVQANSVTVLPLRLTNTGNTDLLLSYSYVINPTASWAIIHLSTGGAFNQGGTDLSGQLLTAGAFVDVTAALEIQPIIGPLGDYTGTITVTGSS